MYSRVVSARVAVRRLHTRYARLSFPAMQRLPLHFRFLRRSQVGIGLVLLGLCVVFWGGPGGARSWGQDIKIEVAQARIGVAAGFAGARVEGGEAPAEDQLAPPSVVFERNLDISTYISRAREFAEIGDYNTVALLLQKVLDDERQILVQVEEGLHRPSDEWVVEFLLGLPPEALEAYRSVADPQARGLLSQGQPASDEEGNFRETAQRYFLSTVGDDAAYQIACRHLTRGEYSLANRWLTRLIELYPDSDLSQSEVWLRGAVAAAELGNRALAEQRFRKSREADGRSRSANAIRAWLGETLEGGPQPPRTADAWPMPWGVPRRNAVPQPPTVAKDGPERAIPWVSRWSVEPRRGEEHLARFKLQNDLLLHSWWSEGLMPTDHVVSDGRRVYLSNARGVRCFTEDGYQLWSEAGTRPFANPSEDEIRAFSRVGGNVGNFRLWTAFEEDMEGRLSVLGDTLYRIEGSWATGKRRVRTGSGRNVSYKHIRSGSRIVAYDKDSGVQRYVLGGGLEGDEGVLSGARFLNAPVPCGRRMLAAYEQNDALHMLAFDPGTGEILWTRTLCSYPTSEGPPQAPAGLLVDSGTVYVSPGQGVVFTLDGYTGSVARAFVYERLAEDASYRNRRGGHSHSSWKENALFLAAGKLLVVPADAQALLAFDVVSGRRAYRVDSKKAEYPLGVHAGVLYALARDRLLGFDAADGRALFDRSLGERPTGRGLVTRRGVLIPFGDRIRRFALRTGKPQTTMQVGMDGIAPLGRLVADGRHLFAAGIGHLLALDSATRVARELAHADSGDANAVDLFRRGVFRRRLGDLQAAAADLNRAYDLTLQSPQQRRIRDLREQLENLDRERQELMAEFAWFSDDFDRPLLGADYTVTQGQVDISDGALRMNAAQNMEVRLNREIPGDFRVTVTGWQPEDADRLCDLSFKMDIEGPGRNVEGLYAQFGTNWNVRNKLQISGRDLQTTTDYLMKAGVRHQLELTRLGSRIVLVVDGIEVLDHSEGRIPAEKETKTTLHLYGFGGTHFYDNLTVTRIHRDGSQLVDLDSSRKATEEFKRRLDEIKMRRRDVRKEVLELEEAGYTGIEPVREELFRTLLEAVAAGAERAEEHLDRASALATDDSERRRIHRAKADLSVRRKDYAEAVESAFAVASGEVREEMLPDARRRGWRVCPETWVRLRLNKLLEAGGDDVRRAIQTVVATRLDTLLADNETRAESLYRLLLASPPVAASVRCGLAAARRAEADGSAAQAELIYLRMGDSRDPLMRVSGRVALAKFAERNGWPVYAYSTWQGVVEEGEGARALVETVPEVVQQTSRNADEATPAVAEESKASTLDEPEPDAEGAEAPRVRTSPSVEEVNAAPLAEQAIGALQQQLDRDVQKLLWPPLPNPPYRKVWQTGERQRLKSPSPGNMWPPSRFMNNHLLVFNYQNNRLRCLSLDDGAEVWHLSSDRRSNYLYRGHAAFPNSGSLYGFSLVTGKRFWSDRGAGGLPGGNRTRANGVQNGVLLLSNNSRTDGYWMGGVDAVTGDLLWAKDSLRRQPGSLPNAGAYVLRQVRRQYGKMSMAVESIVLDRATGEIVNPSLSYTSGHRNPLTTPSGVLIVHEGALKLIGYAEGDVQWQVPLENAVPEGEKAWAHSLRSEYLPEFGYAVLWTSSHLLCVDVEARKRLWTTPLEALAEKGGKQDARSQDIRFSGRITVDYVNRELLFTVTERRGREQRRGIRSVDADTGELRVAVTTSIDTQLRYHTPPVTNSKLLMVTRSVWKRDGRTRRLTVRENRFLRREDGEFVPDLVLPKGVNRDDRRVYVPHQRGNRLIFDKGDHIFVYEPAPKEPAEAE